MKQRVKMWCYRCAAAGGGLVSYFTLTSQHGYHLGHPFF